MFNGIKYTDLDPKLKKCVVCGTEFKAFSGVHKFCSPQCKGKWPYITGQNSTKNQYKKISGNWDRYFARLVQSDKRKKVGLKKEDLIQILIDQNYKCALSGIPLTCLLDKGVRHKTNASLDRKEAGGPYIPQNIQLVCRALNSWRSDTDLQEFLWWCSTVTKYQESKE